MSSFPSLPPPSSPLYNQDNYNYMDNYICQENYSHQDNFNSNENLVQEEGGSSFSIKLCVTMLPKREGQEADIITWNCLKYFINADL